MSNHVNQVTEFLSFLIDNMTIFTVDENNRIITKSTNKHILIGSEPKKRIQLYSDIIKDTKDIIFNPLAETTSSRDKQGNIWFYEQLAIGLFYRIQVVIKQTRELAKLSKTKKGKIELENWSPKTVSLLSNLTSHINDPKFIKFMERYDNDPCELINVYFAQRSKEAIVRTAIYEPKFKNNKSLSKKIKNYISEMIGSFFGFHSEEELSSFREKAVSNKCSTLDAVLRMYAKLYTHFNPYLESLDLQVSVGELRSYIDKLDEFYDKTKWAVQSGDIKVETPIKKKQRQEEQQTTATTSSVTQWFGVDSFNASNSWLTKGNSSALVNTMFGRNSRSIQNAESRKLAELRWDTPQVPANNSPLSWFGVNQSGLPFDPGFPSAGTTQVLVNL